MQTGQWKYNYATQTKSVSDNEVDEMVWDECTNKFVLSIYDVSDVLNDTDGT